MAGSVVPLPDWLDESDRMLGLLNSGFPPVQDMDAAAARALVAGRVRPVDNIDDVAAAEDVVVEGRLRVRIYRPHDAEPKAPAILFFHGGGFVFCCIESHDGFCRRMARGTGCVVASVDYRLAPEHPAPAAVEDAAIALCWLAGEAATLGIDPAGIVVAGDSAGGNIAAVLCLVARDRGLPRPRAQALLYPVIAPDFDTPSYRAYATGHFNTADAMRWYWRNYLGDGAMPDPVEHAVPSRAASLAGLPRAIIHVAGRDPLASEGEAYGRMLSAAGVTTRLRLFPDLFHGFATIPGFGPARAAQEMLWADISAAVSGEAR